MKILVCGGRDYKDLTRVCSVLDDLHFGTGPDGGIGGKQRLITCVITGAARGADAMAEEWARHRQVRYRGYPAQWDLHGKSAGPRRNRDMLLAEHVPDFGRVLGLVVAFPGGRGTADMVRLANEAGIKVMEIRP